MFICSGEISWSCRECSDRRLDILCIPTTNFPLFSTTPNFNIPILSTKSGIADCLRTQKYPVIVVKNTCMCWFILTQLYSKIYALFCCKQFYNLHTFVVKSCYEDSGTFSTDFLEPKIWNFLLFYFSWNRSFGPINGSNLCFYALKYGVFCSKSVLSKNVLSKKSIGRKLVYHQEVTCQPHLPSFREFV